MDLYKFHSKSSVLRGYKEANDTVPERIYNNARKGKPLTNKQEKVFARNARYAFNYAHYVLHRPWPKGEDVLAKEADYAIPYALSVLKKRFLKAEPTIAKSQYKKYYEQEFRIKL